MPVKPTASAVPPPGAFIAQIEKQIRFAGSVLTSEENMAFDLSIRPVVHRGPRLYLGLFKQ